VQGGGRVRTERRDEGGAVAPSACGVPDDERVPASAARQRIDRVRIRTHPYVDCREPGDPASGASREGPNPSGSSGQERDRVPLHKGEVVRTSVTDGQHAGCVPAPARTLSAGSADAAGQVREYVIVK